MGFGRIMMMIWKLLSVSLFIFYFLPQLGYCCMMFVNGRTLPHEGMVTVFVVMVDL